RELQTKIEAAEAERRKSESALAAMPAGPRAASKDAAPAAQPNKGDIVGAIQRDPKLQVLELASRHAEFQGRYGPLLQALQLTPEQVAALADTRTHAIEQQNDIAAVMADRNLASNDPAILELRRQSADEQYARQIEVLGDDGYGKLREYERTLPAREIVG